MDIATALSLLVTLLGQTNRLAELIRNARAEGRTDLTEEELDTLVNGDDAARARLQALIDSID